VLTDIVPAVAASKHTTAPISHTRPSHCKHSPDGTTLIEVADIRLQLTTHLSTSKGQKAELAWLADGAADGLPTQVVTHQLQVERRTESSHAKD